jgi:hypothetical protein
MDRTGKPQAADMWDLAHGGIRGSTALIGGAMALAGAAALGLVAEVATGISGGGAAALVATANLAWIVVLGVIGWGLVAVGVGPVLSRLGLVVGLVYGCEAVLHLLSAALITQPEFTLRAVAIGRLVLVTAFAAHEQQVLGTDLSHRLGKVALAHAASVVLMAVVVPYGARPLVGQILDTVFGVALAAPLWQAAQVIREAEAAWAMRSLEEFEDTGLETFNNPDHEHVVQR